MKKSGLAAALVAASLFSSQAQAACWTEEEVAAARVREMETMLMVSSLRCRLKGVDFLPAYNQFIRSARPALSRVNDVLRAHFVTEAGAGHALNAYDRFVTGIANKYGGGAGERDCRELAGLVDEASAEGEYASRLDRLAMRSGADPQLTGGRCPWRIAAR